MQESVTSHRDQIPLRREVAEMSPITFVNRRESAAPPEPLEECCTTASGRLEQDHVTP